jgi:hypothetical protein
MPHLPFKAFINEVFAELLRKGVLVFMDEILIYSKTLDGHIALMKQVFGILEKHQFLIKRSKCSFARTTMEYLGHVIFEAGVATNQSKIQAVSS